MSLSQHLAAVATASLLGNYWELGISHHLTGCEQWFSLLQTEVDVEEYLLALDLALVVRDGEVLGLLCRNIEVGDGTILSLYAILFQAPCQGIVAQVAEEVLIMYTYLARLGIHHLSPDVLVLISHLVSVRVHLTVWTDDTITVEVIVARIILVVITTVAIFYLAKLLIVHLVRQDAHGLHDIAVQCLIYEVPVETTLEDRILADQIPVIAQVTARVTHGVVVLTLDEWHRTVWILGILLRSSYRIVHWAEDICTLATASLLILNRAGLVLLLDPLVSLEEVVAHHGLVTQAPGYDRRMVVEHRHIVLVALHDLLGKLRLLGSRIVAILETMALLVSLSHNIQSVLVAEIIPARIVWIVAGTNGIDVHALHHHDVLNHALLT